MLVVKTFFKTFFATFFLPTLLANTPGTLLNQNNTKIVNFFPPFIDINNADFHYVYGPDGDKIVSLNFSRTGILVSKTTYVSVKQKNTFLYNDDCKSDDCQKFIH
mgnify:FL=1